MSAAQPMSSARRRPIPGMASQPITPPAPAPTPAPAPVEANHHVDDDARASEAEGSTTPLAEGNDAAAVRSDGRRRTAREPVIERRPAADYASTFHTVAAFFKEQQRGLLRFIAIVKGRNP